MAPDRKIALAAAIIGSGADEPDECDEMKPVAILFDLDDTLTDRRGSLRRCVPFFYERFPSGLGDVTPDAFFNMLCRVDDGGYRDRTEMFAEIIAGLTWRDAPLPRVLADLWIAEFPRFAHPREGCVDTLACLKAEGLRLGLVTNGINSMQRSKIRCMGCEDYFEVVVTSESARCFKPDPRIFQAALDALDVRADQTWFVGDHPINDMDGARRAGMKSVWVDRAFPWPHGLPCADYQIHDLHELLPILFEP